MNLEFDKSLTYHSDTHSIYFGHGFYHPFDGFEILLVVTHHNREVTP